MKDSNLPSIHFPFFQLIKNYFGPKNHEYAMDCDLIILILIIIYNLYIYNLFILNYNFTITIIISMLKWF